jgi:hypothetical protein
MTKYRNAFLAGASALDSSGQRFAHEIETTLTHAVKQDGDSRALCGVTVGAYGGTFGGPNLCPKCEALVAEDS